MRKALTALRDSFADLRFDISEMVDLEERVVTGTFGCGGEVRRLLDPRPSARW